MILEVRNMAKNFGGTEVLRDINLSMEKGQVISIIGSSGSGKTTLLRCLNFLETPQQGQILVNGEMLLDCGDPRPLKEEELCRARLHFGLVFQQFNLFPQYTVLANVTLAEELLARRRLKRGGEYLGCRTVREATEAIRAKGLELLRQVGLYEKRDAYPCQLSGGQQQRVAIARALALEPDILCFDEPTSALDPELTGEVLRVIRELKERRHTMIIVTHEMQFARDVSDYVYFMDGGVIAESGVPEAVFGNPQQERTRQFLQRYSEG